MAVAEEVLGTFHGSDEFPIEWQEGEKELFWIYDDLHIPNPVSPMFFDIGGWWLTCDHMFRRFGTPFASRLDRQGDQRLRLHGRRAGRLGDPQRGDRVPGPLRPARAARPRHAGKIGAYLGWVLPEYAGNFLAWWRERLRPEIERNFEYLDGIDYDAAKMREMAVYLEDAIDVHDRHWKIHWMLNFAQFSSTTNLNAVIADVRGGEDPGLMGRLQSSLEDRNWDSIEDLWKLKEEIKGDQELSAAFEGETAADVMRALDGSDRGKRFVEERIVAHQKTFGYKSIWSHEFAFKTWREDSAPIVEAIRGYIATDYDYPSNIQSVRDDLEAAKVEVMEGVDGDGRETLQEALDLSLGMNPLTPDHHFYIDQGTNARLRIALIAIGGKLADAGVLDDAEDVMYLRYNELRLLMADQSAFDAHELVSDRRDYREDAAERRPPSWVGTATQTALDFPYNALWGFPEKFYAGEPSTTGEVKGLAASPGVVEGAGPLRRLARRVRPGARRARSSCAG